MINMYGITETTVHTTYLELTSEDAERGVSPIGGPLGNVRVFVLDAGLCPVPVGVAGELYVAGAQVARGIGVGGVDRAAVCGVSVRACWVADVSQRGFGALEQLGGVGVCGPRR
ncbi:hypothetical protein MMRN_32940 [Mycobacterium marinum]|nr:hypothetical protein MMRN_32940 [Mycobacterium marinum]